MTQEEKQLVFIDLCARLPYGVVVECTCITRNNEYTSKLTPITRINGYTSKLTPYTLYFVMKDNWSVKPYLRPMSSTTVDERTALTKLFDKWYDDELFDYIEEGTEFSIWKHKGISPVVFDWLNSNHFDYSGLIEKGLALEASKDMYKNEQI